MKAIGMAIFRLGSEDLAVNKIYKWRVVAEAICEARNAYARWKSRHEYLSYVETVYIKTSDYKEVG